MTVATDQRSGAFVDVQGTPTYYHEAGSGEPVLLLHGSGPGVSAWANWQHTIPVLARGARVLAPDGLGYGQTAKPTDVRYSLRTWSDHVWGFLEALGLEQVSIVGNSLGGRIALQMAEDAPHRISRLVLMGTPGVGMRATEGLTALRAYQPSLAAMRELLTSYFAVDTSIITEELVRIRYEASVAPGAHEAYRAMFLDPHSAGNELAISEQQTRATAIATLLVHGLQDKVIPVEVAWNMARLLPDADLHVFARCGHWTQIERADEFNRLVAGFLGIEPAAAA